MLVASEQLHSQRSAADFTKQMDPLHEESCLQVLPIAADAKHQTMTILSHEVFLIYILLCSLTHFDGPHISIAATTFHCTREQNEHHNMLYCDLFGRVAPHNMSITAVQQKRCPE